MQFINNTLFKIQHPFFKRNSLSDIEWINEVNKMMENEFDLNNNNILSSFHIRKIDEDGLNLCPKMYTWYIPKTLRSLNIQPGDIVQVYATMEDFSL